MNATAATKPIRVSGHGTPLPYIMLEVSQLDRVRSILDAGGIKYDVDGFSIALNSGPAMTYINLQRGTDAQVIQDLLDQN